MSKVNRNLDRRLRASLYQMKRLFGDSISVYKINSSTVNTETGLVSMDRSVYPIRRAIVLPEKIDREVERTISVISSNKQILQGGFFDAGTRVFIIDRNETNLDGITLDKDDYVVWRNRKYSISHFQEYELEGWIVTGKHLIGEVPQQIFLLSADSLIELEQDSGGV